MAAPGQRPTGLTVLAVLNFVFGGLGLLGLLALVALLGAFREAIQQATKEQLPSSGILYFLILLSLIQVGLLIASGVGYLGQKRFLGKGLGNAYAILALVGAVISIATVGKFDFSTIIGLIYPVLTLVLLNVVFKDDFHNP
jgi:hypothetical protein